MDINDAKWMLSFMQKKNPQFKEYQKVRKLHQEIYDKMDITFNEDDRKMFTNIIKSSNCDGIYFDFSIKQHEKIYAEFLIYPQISGIQSKIEYLRQHTRIRKAEKLDMIDAMIDSTYGMFEVVQRDDMNGVTYLENVFTHEQIPLMDGSLGMFGQLEDAYIYIHIIRYHNIYFQTGLIIGLNKNKETFKWLKQNKKIFMKPYDVSQFLLVEKYSRIHKFKI
ncbi:MAG: hypothetical protein LUG46_02300 [Erysipelotrichaceae bacterium]|nr:hypothetical protein [Erysipelotrichaceae bacterium]